MMKKLFNRFKPEIIIISLFGIVITLVIAIGIEAKNKVNEVNEVNFECQP